MRAEDKLRDEINKCRNCQACETLLDFSCPAFREMFKLVDQERDSGKQISTNQLIHLVGLCSFCAACPCSDIRAAIIDAKTEYMDQYGLGFRIRAIENVDRIGKWGGALPPVTNFLLQNKVTGVLIKKALGIHRDRKFPSFPKENFAEWLSRRQKKHVEPTSRHDRKVAYFPGCTAGYLFPEIPKAVVEILERNGVEVFYLGQQCCGMPSLLEGDRKLTLKFASANVARLAQAVKDGYHIVCSCPTCGFMLKNVLNIGAHDPAAYRASMGSTHGFVKIRSLSSAYGPFLGVPDTLLETLLRDNEYFSAINPKTRRMVADNTVDLGEFLRMLHMRSDFDTKLGPVRMRVAYYPPCHLREQNIGTPYQYLLGLIPELSVQTIDGDYCCGNAGIMGFKQEFHRSSIKIASRLISRIKALGPEVIATDCLSCSIQLNQLTHYEILHPLQIIKESYTNYREQTQSQVV